MIWLSEDDYMKTYGEWDYEARVVNDSVCWMNYKITGIPLSPDKDGIMRVIPWDSRNDRGINGSPYIESFLVRADRDDERFICPFKQEKDNTKWAHVITSKMESNLDIWIIKVFGCDDASYTCHFLAEQEMLRAVDILKDVGITAIEELGFFFTN